MRYLIAVILIAGCSVFNSEDSIYPIQKGGWEISSETTAEWIGLPTTPAMEVASIDTLFFYEPDRQSVQFIYNPGEFWNELVITDSLFTRAEQSEMVGRKTVSIEFVGENDQIIFSQGYDMSYRDDRMKTRLFMYFTGVCRHIPQIDEVMNFSYTDSLGQGFAYQFHFQGFQETLEYFYCD